MCPAGEAGASPHSEDFLRSVRRDHQAHDGADEGECEIGADD